MDSSSTASMLRSSPEPYDDSVHELERKCCVYALRVSLLHTRQISSRASLPIVGSNDLGQVLSNLTIMRKYVSYFYLRFVAGRHLVSTKHANQRPPL